MLYGSVNESVLKRVPPTATRILDLGCGIGALGRALKSLRAAEVVGVTFSAEEAEKARLALDEVIVQDLNQFIPTGLGTFDCVICSHVLEHLHSPNALLTACL